MTLSADNDIFALSADNAGKEVANMASIRFDLNPEYASRLDEDAKAAHMNIQDYIRYKLFGVKNVYNVDEVLRRIYNCNDCNFDPSDFSLPDLFTAEEWAQLGRGPAGVLGRQFYSYTLENPDCGVEFTTIGKDRRAHYKYEKGVIK